MGTLFKFFTLPLYVSSMASLGKILLVDDDELVLLSLKVLLEQHQFETIGIQTPERIPALLEKEQIHTIILDMNYQPGSTASTEGLYWLSRVVAHSPELPVIPLTAFGDVSLAVQAMRLGAHDFITKPWQNEKLVATVKSAVALFREKQKVKQLSAKQKMLNTTLVKKVELLGESPAVQSIRNKIEKIAPTDATILLLGANGTGKEVIARNIHNQSTRKDQPFVSVDVGSINEALFESELFGHKKGAFTDAKEDRIGRIEVASGGTLFLDEIGNLSLSLQSKLLTMLQNRTITRVGANNPIEIDVRIICATNSNIKQLVDDGKFREDLYYRINTVEIILPSLFERPEDIPVLAFHYLEKFGTHYRKLNRTIPEEVMQVLQKYRWPGNVRELQHAVERAVVLSEHSALTLEDFGVTKKDDQDSLIFDYLNLEKLEAWAIRKAVDKHKGNISHAAQELGLSRGAMYRRMERYGI